MVSTFSPNKRIELPAFNDYVNSWNVPVNADWSIIDLALGSGVNINLTGLSGNQTLTAAQYQPLKLILAGTPTAVTNVVIPAGVGGLWVVRNNVTTFVVTISSASGGASVAIPANTNTLVTCDGSATGMFLAINTPPVAGGLPAQIQINNGGFLGGDPNLTWLTPTLNTTGLNVTGNTILGDAAGDTLTINGTAASAPNGLAVNTNQLVLKGTPFNQVAIGTTTVGSEMLTVAGAIKTTAGGIVFPDNTTMTTAASWRLLTRIVPTAGQFPVVFSTVPTDINDLMIDFDITPTANASDLLFNFVDATGTIISGANQYSWATVVGYNGMASGSAAITYNSVSQAYTSGILLNGAIAGGRIANGAPGGTRGRITIYNIKDTARPKAMSWQSNFSSENALFVSSDGNGWTMVTGGLKGFRLGWIATTTYAAGGSINVWGAT